MTTLELAKLKNTTRKTLEYWITALGFPLPEHQLAKTQLIDIIKTYYDAKELWC